MTLFESLCECSQIDLLLGQVSFHPEQGSVNRQVDVFRKAVYLMPNLTQRRAALEDEFVREW